MQKFFDQVKTLLADDITLFSSETPNGVYIELKYRDRQVEMDYNAAAGYGNKIVGVSPGAVFLLSIDLGSDLELEILPKSFIDRLFDVQAGVSLFDGAKKIKINIPLLKDEVLLHTNKEEIAKNFMLLPEVGKVLSDYGIAFFKIESGELKVYLDELPAGKFEELKSNPSLIKNYLDILVNLADSIKG